MEKNVEFFKRMEKNRMFRTEKNPVPNPALSRLFATKNVLVILYNFQILNRRFSTEILIKSK